MAEDLSAVRSMKLSYLLLVLVLVVSPWVTAFVAPPLGSVLTDTETR